MKIILGLIMALLYASQVNAQDFEESPLNVCLQQGGAIAECAGLVATELQCNSVNVEKLSSAGREDEVSLVTMRDCEAVGLAYRLENCREDYDLEMTICDIVAEGREPYRYPCVCCDGNATNCKN